MKKMSTSEQRKMLRALDKAADYTKEGLDPDQALTKVSEEFELGAPMIERVCEAYNKANAVAYMKSAPESKRADNHPIAKIANVVNNIYGVKEKVAEEVSFKKKDYAKLGFHTTEKPMAKVASEKRSHNPVHRKSIAASLEILQGQMEKLSRRTKDNKTKAEYAVRQGLEELTKAIQHLPVTITGRRELTKIAHNMVDAYGEEDAHIIINATNANGDDPSRYMECFSKEASAVILPDKPVYRIATKLLKDREHMVEMQKEANAGTMNSGVGDIIEPMTSTLDKLPSLLPSPDKIHMDVSTGMTGEWDAYEKDLKSRRMLYDMMLNDEEISAYSPRKIQGAYNDIVETFPELSKQRKILRAILRKSLAQGGNMDIYEIKDLISASKERMATDKDSTLTRSELNKAINSAGAGGNDSRQQSLNITIGNKGK